MADLDPLHQMPPRGSPERPELRAGDDDRGRVVGELQRHYVDGRLTQEELDERISGALDARTFGDLNALIHDLPQAPASPSAQSVPTLPDDEADRGGKGLLAHATSYALVMALLIMIWLLTTPGGYFWPVWPMLGWGIGLAAHGIGQHGVRRTARAARRGRRARRRAGEQDGS